MSNRLIDTDDFAGGVPTSYQNSEGAGGTPTYFDNINRVEKPIPGTGSAKRNTIILFGRELERDLLVSKIFYLFFYAAFGSLFPLIAVYFKQLGMNSTQAGILIGIRPFVEFLSAPFWGQFSDKFRKGRQLLLFTLTCWIVFTVAMGYPRPTIAYCLTKVNDSDRTYWRLTDPAVGGISSKAASPDARNEPNHTVGIAPIPLSKSIINYKTDTELVRPPFSYRIYDKSGVEEAFLLLFLLICLGEFFSAPAVHLADACTLSYVEDTPQLYGRQRLFGSVGWAVSMLVVGVLLDSSEAFSNHPCRYLKDTEKNYTLCFVVFTILMVGALAVSTQFRFYSDHDRPDEVPARIMDAQTANIDPAMAENARARAPEPSRPVEAGPAWIPEWWQTLKTFKAPPYLAFLFVTWWMGFGVGLVFSFLFWHLQDLRGSPTLFGIASVINHVSEIIAYFYSFQLINKIGHIKVLYIGLLANAGRFFFISIINNPFFVLPFEFIQGLTHAAVWAAATSFISLTSPTSQKASAQHLLQALHHGIGKGCGAIISGIVITYTGTKAMFAAYGFISLAVLAGYYAINRFHKAGGIKYAATDFEDDGSAALAPHGIPMSVPYKEHSGDYGATETPPAPDPTQDAYDKYVLQGGYGQ